MKYYFGVLYKNEHYLYYLISNNVTGICESYPGNVLYLYVCFAYICRPLNGRIFDIAI
jgi:hypothetical protein